MSSEEPELQLPDPLDEDLGFLEEFTDIFGTRISLGDVVEWDGREPYDDRPFVAFQEHGEDPSREIVAGQFCFTQLQQLNKTHFKYRYIDPEIRSEL